MGRVVIRESCRSFGDSGGSGGHQEHTGRVLRRLGQTLSSADTGNLDYVLKESGAWGAGSWGPWGSCGLCLVSLCLVREEGGIFSCLADKEPSAQGGDDLAHSPQLVHDGAGAEPGSLSSRPLTVTLARASPPRCADQCNQGTQNGRFPSLPELQNASLGNGDRLTWGPSLPPPRSEGYSTQHSTSTLIHQCRSRGPKKQTAPPPLSWAAPDSSHSAWPSPPPPLLSPSHTWLCPQP